MNRPTSTTRFIGTPRIANVLYLSAGLMVLAWFSGAISWWLALMAVCSVGTVRKAVADVRRYDAWASNWKAMGQSGTASAPSAPKRSFRMRHKDAPPWVGVTIAALSLLIIPVFMTAPGADESLRGLFTLLWLGAALYLVWKTAAKLRRAFSKATGTVGAGTRKSGVAADVVQWAIPRATSSPSRADAVCNLPEYSARLLGN